MECISHFKQYHISSEPQCTPGISHSRLCAVAIFCWATGQSPSRENGRQADPLIKVQLCEYENQPFKLCCSASRLCSDNKLRMIVKVAFGATMEYLRNLYTIMFIVAPAQNRFSLAQDFQSRL